MSFELFGLGSMMIFESRSNRVNAMCSRTLKPALLAGVTVKPIKALSLIHI